MHILIIPFSHFLTERYPAGGIFQYAQAAALRAAGHQVGIISPDVISPRFLFRSYGYRHRETMDGIEVYRHYERTLLIQRFIAPSSTVRRHQRVGMELYDEYVRDHGRPDVIHAHNALSSAAVAKAILDRDRVPYVITEHSSLYARAVLKASVSRQCHPLLAAASAVTAVSSYLAGRLTHHFGAIAPSVSVLPNVLGPRFVRTLMVPVAKVAGQTFLSVGSLDDNKNHAMLIDAFARRFRGTAATLRIAGTGPLRQRLEQIAKRCGVDNQVAFLGFLDRSTLRLEVSFADCLVLSSFVETFGVVLIEALSCGVPVVATRCGGVEDIVNERNGILVPPGQVDALGTAMVEMMENLGRYPPDQLREDCLRRFGPGRFVAAATEIYERAMAGAS